MTCLNRIYSSTIESEETVLADLMSILARNLVDAQTAQEVKLAVSEAFTNAVIHGNRGDSSKKIRLEVDINESRIRTDIIDEGAGGLARIKNRPATGALAENGRGIALIEHYASRTEFRELKSGGLRVSLTFNRQDNTTQKRDAELSDGGKHGNSDETGRKCRYPESERQT